MDQEMLLGPQENIPSSTDHSGSQLQQICELAKTAKDRALLDIIKNTLEAPGIYVFGELLALPNVEELKNTENKIYFNTLHLFAYGTCKEYRKKPEDYLPLTPVMHTKLQHLTLVTMAIKNKSIPYQQLLEELEISNIRKLEDIIIEAIYADIIHGKLFQDRKILEVDFAKGRDIPPDYISKIGQILQEWVASGDNILECIAEQIEFANNEKAKRLRKKDQIDDQIKYLRKVLKQSDVDDVMQVDSLDFSAASSHDVRKKANKVKIIRTSSKK